MGKGDGLRTLQVRIAGHDGVRVLSAWLQSAYELYDELYSVRCPIAQVEPGVQGDLVVPAPGRVQLAPGISQALRQNASTKLCMSSAAGSIWSLARSLSPQDAAQPFNDCCALASEIMPIFASTPAWAMLPRISCLYIL